MRRVMERLNTRMSAFMTQREDAALVVQCDDNAAAIVLRSIQGVDESSRSDFFFVFPETFVEPAAYVEAIFVNFAAEHASTRAGMPALGLAPWPEIPAGLRNPAQPPIPRLREIMSFARSLLPRQGNPLLGWVMFPLAIADTAAWAAFAAELLRHDWPYPWLRGMRIYLRDMVNPPPLTAATLEAPRVDHCYVDLSNEIIEKGLQEDAGDPTLPVETRLNCVLILGGMDQSHRRYDDAIVKYDCVLRSATKLQNQVLAVAALNGLGEVMEKKGEDDRADKYFGAAITSSEGAPVPTNPALFMATLNSANLALRTQRWADAEHYYAAAEQMANVQSSPRTRVECMENRAVALYMQQKVPEALALWDFAEHCARGGEHFDLAERILRKALDHYRLLSDEPGISRTESRIASAQRREPATGPAPTPPAYAAVPAPQPGGSA